MRGQVLIPARHDSNKDYAVHHNRFEFVETELQDGKHSFRIGHDANLYYGGFGDTIQATGTKVVPVICEVDFHSDFTAVTPMKDHPDINPKD